MPDLRFKILGVEPAARGLAPLLHFRLAVECEEGGCMVESVLLQAQIQIQTNARPYFAQEKERMGELFGPPAQWGRTLHPLLWAHSSTTVPRFERSVEAILPVPCTYDLQIASAKYLDALEGGDIPLLFLFSGTVFYSDSGGRLLVQRIPWEQECSWRMPAALWRGLMEVHFPNSAWISMHRDLFERLCRFRRREGLASWEQVIERLLPCESRKPEPAPLLP